MGPSVGDEEAAQKLTHQLETSLEAEPGSVKIGQRPCGGQVIRFTFDSPTSHAQLDASRNVTLNPESESAVNSVAIGNKIGRARGELAATTLTCTGIWPAMDSETLHGFDIALTIRVGGARLEIVTVSMR